MLTIKVEQVNKRLNSTSEFLLDNSRFVGVAFILFCVLCLSLQKQVACNHSNSTKLHYLGRQNYVMCVMNTTQLFIYSVTFFHD